MKFDEVNQDKTSQEEIREKFNNLTMDYYNCSCFTGCESCIPNKFALEEMIKNYPWLRKEQK